MSGSTEFGRRASSLRLDGYAVHMQRDDGQDIPVAVQARFQEALRTFRAECFWSWDTAQPIIDRNMAREVIRALRLYGGKPGWRAAADLVRCL